MIVTLTWKELREHRAIWLTMVIMTCLIGVGLARVVAVGDERTALAVTTLTVLLFVGAAVAMIPGLPVFELLIFVQVLNGALLPVTLFFVWRLSRNEELMGEYRNGRVFDAVAAVTVIATGALSLVLVGLTLTGKA